jgi:hypothetical protein
MTRPTNGGPNSLQPPSQLLQQQSLLFQNQAHLLAQQMNNNPSLMQMNTPLGSNSLPNPPSQQILAQQQQYFYQQQQQQPIISVNAYSPMMGSVGSHMMGNSGKFSNTHQMPMMNNQNGINPQVGNFQSSVNNNGQLRYRPNQLLRPPTQHQIPMNTNNRNPILQQPFRPPLGPEAIAAAKISAETREHAQIIRSRLSFLIPNLFFL